MSKTRPVNKSLAYEKYNYIRANSDRCIVVCGPSGVGKTMSVEHLVKKYGCKSVPFITTRNLRAEEGGTGSLSVNYESFMDMRLKNEVFLFAHNYGNSYGYYVDEVYRELLAGSVIVLECPAAQLLTDVQVLLPSALVLGYVLFDHTMTSTILETRGGESNAKSQLRVLQSAIESYNVQLAAEKMSLYRILPVLGDPQNTIDQVDAAIHSHIEFRNLTDDINKGNTLTALL